MKVTNNSKKLRILTVLENGVWVNIYINTGETVEDERITADTVKPYANVDDLVVDAGDETNINELLAVEDPAKLKVEELKQLLEYYKLETTGNKAELLERLNEHEAKLMGN